MPLSEFASLFALATAMSFSPGPNTTLSAALAANGGLRSALPFVCAVPLGWAMLMLLCAFGLGLLVLQAPVLHWAVKGAGCAYLLSLAWRLARSGAGMGAGANTAPHTGFFQGVALQFLNIKAWALALAITAGWVLGKPDFAQRLPWVVLTMMAFAFCSNFTYALVGAGLRKWLAQGQRLAWFNRAMAAVLTVTALGMLFV